MFHYNTIEHAKERSETGPLTLEEEMQVVEALNILAVSPSRLLVQNELPLIQRFLNHYQNMSHYVAYSNGLTVVGEGSEPVVGSYEFIGGDTCVPSNAGDLEYVYAAMPCQPSQFSVRAPIFLRPAYPSCK